MPATTQQQRRESPPKGFELIHTGEIQAGDQVWDESDQEWTEVSSEEIGDDAEGYYAIARKVSND